MLKFAKKPSDLFGKLDRFFYYSIPEDLKKIERDDDSKKSHHALATR